MSAVVAPAAIRPQVAQERFLATPADLGIFGGAAGGGKTYALLLEPLRHVHTPSFRCEVFRRTYPQITQPGGLWQKSEELYAPLGARPRFTSLEWIFPSGARVKFAHMQYEQDRLSWKGAQIDLIVFDQLEEFTADQFWYLLSRNRSVSGIRPYVRAGCNPVPDDDSVGGWLHHLLAWWIDAGTGYPVPTRAGALRWFARGEDDALDWDDDPAPLRARHPGQEPKSVAFVPATLADNAILTTRDPGYRATLMALPRVDRLRLLGGNWTVRPAAGAVFSRAWFVAVDAAPVRAQRVRYWDKAGTAAAGDWTVGVRMARTDGLVWVEDVARGQWSAFERNRVMRQVAEADGPAVEIYVEQEPGSGGKESAEISIRDLAGFVVRADRPTGDLVTRAGPFAAQAEAGNVRLVRAPWTEAYLREHHDFPDGAHDDQVSASAGAFNKLALRPGAIRVALLGELRTQTDDERRQTAAAAVASALQTAGVYWPDNGR